jgi:hypothetical protein
LLTLVNLGCIPIHLMNCRLGALDQPDWIESALMGLASTYPGTSQGRSGPPATRPSCPSCWA